MKSLTTPEIPKRTVHCCHRGEPFIPGMDVYSWLYEKEDHQIGRSDYCTACWQELHREVCSKPESKGYWKSKIEPKIISPASSRIGRALNLLKELRENPTSPVDEIFVLCLFLSHARQLALRQEFQQEGVSYQLYEILRQEEFITIKTLKLEHNQVETIQKSLALKLN